MCAHIMNFSNDIAASLSGEGKKQGDVYAVHLDRIWWLPGWVNRSEEEFDALLFEELEKPA